jgi:hypothetical protein
MCFCTWNFCVVFHSQSDLLNMTMYDLVYEDDQSELYSAMLSPASTVDTMHYSDTKGWSCVAGKIWSVAVIVVGLFSTLHHNISTTPTFVDKTLQLEVTWTHLYTLLRYVWCYCNFKVISETGKIGYICFLCFMHWIDIWRSCDY